MDKLQELRTRFNNEISKDTGNMSYGTYTMMYDAFCDAIEEARQYGRNEAYSLALGLSNEKGEVHEEDVLRDTEMDMYRAFRDELRRRYKFDNGDSLRSLEDNAQLALRLWNLPKFNSCEELAEWLNKEHKGA